MLFSPHILPWPASDSTLSVRKSKCIKTNNSWKICWDVKYKSNVLNNTPRTEEKISLTHILELLKIPCSRTYNSSALCYCRSQAFRFSKYSPLFSVLLIPAHCLPNPSLSLLHSVPYALFCLSQSCKRFALTSERKKKKRKLHKGDIPKQGCLYKPPHHGLLNLLVRPFCVQ